MSHNNLASCTKKLALFLNGYLLDRFYSLAHLITINQATGTIRARALKLKGAQTKAAFFLTCLTAEKRG